MLCGSLNILVASNTDVLRPCTNYSIEIISRSNNSGSKIKLRQQTKSSMNSVMSFLYQPPVTVINTSHQSRAANNYSSLNSRHKTAPQTHLIHSTTESSIAITGTFSIIPIELNLITALTYVQCFIELNLIKTNKI